MKSKQATPRYAVRLVVLLAGAVFIFFGGLQLFVPAGSRLTGSYDAASLKYIAAAPLAYAGSASCGTANCHEKLYTTWSQGAHGANKEQSKCEVCHGPQRDHPKTNLLRVRGDGDVVKLCLTCHQKMKARKTTGQPQIEPQQHPYPHQEVLKCTQCHNPHSPSLRKANVESTPATSTTPSSQQAAEAPAQESTATVAAVKQGSDEGAQLATNCFGCHGPAGQGGFAPKLAGQAADVLKKKITDFKTGTTKGTLMNGIAAPLKDQDIELLAKYFSQQS